MSLNRPERLNALGVTIADELRAALKLIESDGLCAH